MRRSRETAAPGRKRAGTPAAVTDETPPALNDFGQYLDTTVQARAAALVELNSDTLVYGMNLDEKLYPASLTKIMTCMLALEHGNLDDIVTVSHAALQDLNAAGSSAGLLEGEQLSLRELLYCVMISVRQRGLQRRGGVHRGGYPFVRGAHECAGGGPRHDRHAFCQCPRPA